MSIEKQCRAYSIPNIVSLPTLEQPIEVELLIPEYCPDIIKILKCDIKNRVLNKKINNQSLEIDCCSEITIIYCGDDNIVSSVITKYNYSKTFENKLFNNNYVEVKISSNDFNCRQTSSRRLEVKGSVNVSIDINAFEVKEVISNIERDDIEQLHRNHDMTTTVFTQEKQLLIEDELLLSSDKPDINYIIRQSATAIINESKQIGDKAVIKGNIKVDILYCSVNNSPAFFSELIPFSQIIELNSQNKTCNITSNVKVTSFDVKPIINSTSNTGFLINIGLNVVLYGKCNLPITLVEDCYSTKVNTDICKDKINIDRLVDTINDKVVIKKTLTLNESQISSMIDLWCNEVKISSMLNDENIKLSGNIECLMLFCNIDNIPEYKEFKFDYEFNKKVTNNDKENYVAASHRIISSSYTLLSDNQVEVQIELQIFAEIFEKIECEFICDLLENDKPIECDDSIIIYFCDKEESTWNIAKKFLTPVKLLIEQNEINDDIVSSQSVLVISRMWGGIYE